MRYFSNVWEIFLRNIFFLTLNAVERSHFDFFGQPNCKDGSSTVLPCWFSICANFSVYSIFDFLVILSHIFLGLQIRQHLKEICKIFALFSLFLLLSLFIWLLPQLLFDRYFLKLPSYSFSWILIYDLFDKVMFACHRLKEAQNLRKFAIESIEGIRPYHLFLFLSALSSLPRLQRIAVKSVSGSGMTLVTRLLLHFSTFQFLEGLSISIFDESSDSSSSFSSPFQYKSLPLSSRTLTSSLVWPFSPFFVNFDLFIS